MNRAAAQENADAIASDEVNMASCPVSLSTGSSGQPLNIPTTPLENLYENFLWVKGYMACGARPWHVQAKLTTPENVPGQLLFLQKLGFFRRANFSVDEPPEKIAHWLGKNKPRSLVCWSSMLNEICTYLDQANEMLEIPLVFATSDMLWPDVRKRAEERLHARVVDVYGTVETGPIAWQCPKGSGYHVRSDDTVVEILDENDQPANKGRVVCTVLWRRAFPLIRYCVGDLAEWAQNPCPCGSPFPRLEGLHGREQELIRLPNGERVSSFTLRLWISDSAHVRQYQMVQESPNSFLLRIVPDIGYTNEIEQSIAADFQIQFGTLLQLRILKVSAIARPPEVKYTSFITLDRLEQMRASGIDTNRFLA